MYTVLLAHDTVLTVPVQSTSDMCIQYFWSMYTILNIPVYSILLVNANCTIGPSCRLLVHMYTVLLVRVYSTTGMCIQFYWSMYTALGGLSIQY